MREVIFLLLHMREGEIAPTIVVAVVAEQRGEFGRFPELIFPFIGEQSIEAFAACLERGMVSRQRERREQRPRHDHESKTAYPHSHSQGNSSIVDAAQAHIGIRPAGALPGFDPAGWYGSARSDAVGGTNCGGHALEWEFGRDSAYFSRGEPPHVARSNWAFEWMGTAACFSDFVASARPHGALGRGEAQNGKPPVGFSKNHCFGGP